MRATGGIEPVPCLGEVHTIADRYRMQAGEHLAQLLRRADATAMAPVGDERDRFGLPVGLDRIDHDYSAAEHVDEKPP
jgi:hypothetical protein